MIQNVDQAARTVAASLASTSSRRAATVFVTFDILDL